jgi:hypothetical protein
MRFVTSVMVLPSVAASGLPGGLCLNDAADGRDLAITSDVIVRMTSSKPSLSP